MPATLEIPPPPWAAQAEEKRGPSEANGDAPSHNGGAAAVAAPEPAAETPTEAPSAEGLRNGTKKWLAALATGIVVAAGVIAFLAAPDKKDRSETRLPVTTMDVPEAAKRAFAPPRGAATGQPGSAGALAAAKRMKTAVLSGVPTPGIARRTAKRLSRRGFRVSTAANAPAPSERSYVMHAARARGEARALARTLRIRKVVPLDTLTRSFADGAKLVVVLGRRR